MVINIQDTNYSIGGTVNNTEDTNYSIEGMVIATQDTTYSIGAGVHIIPFSIPFGIDKFEENGGKFF